MACLALSLSVIACSTPPEKPAPEPPKPVMTPERQDIPDYSATYFNKTRSGAAYLQEGHKHAIVARRDQVLITPPPSDSGAGNSLSLESDNDSQSRVTEETGNLLAMTGGDQLSPEEFRAWQKHCSGIPLTNEEHSLLYKFNGEIPEQFAENCQWNK